MQLSMAGLATSIGQPTEAISSFSQAIKVSFNGLDEAGIQEKVKEALADYNEGLASAFIASVDRSELPKWVDRLMGNVDATAVERLQAIADYPAKLLQSFGTSRDQLAQLYAEGLATGDAYAAGQSVANSLVASIEASMLGNASGQIIDIVNQGIITPIIDAAVMGQNVAEALSQASIAKTIERAKATATAFAELISNAEFQATLAQLRTTVGDALGTAGAALGTAGAALQYTPRYTAAIVENTAATQAATDAQREATRVAEERRNLQDQIDELTMSRAQLLDKERNAIDASNRDLFDRLHFLQEEKRIAEERSGLEQQWLQITGNTAELRRSELAALDPANRSLQELVWKLTDLRAASEQLGGLLPGVIKKFLTPDQLTSSAYESIADDLLAAGLSGMDRTALTQGLIGASKDEIAALAMEIFNMQGISVDAQLALVKAVDGLADLKDAAQVVAKEAERAAEAERQRIAQQRSGLEISLLGLLGETAELRRREIDALDPSNRALQTRIWGLQDAAAATDAAFSTLEQSVGTRRTAVQQVAQEMGALFDYLREQARTLRQEVVSTRAMDAAQGRAYIGAALATVRTSGYLPDIDELRGAVDGVRAHISTRDYATQFEADRDTLVLAGQLQELADAASPQLTVAEQQLKMLDGLLESAREQIDLVRGIKKHLVDDPKEAARQVQSAIEKEQAERAAAMAQVSSPNNPATQAAAHEEFDYASLAGIRPVPNRLLQSHTLAPEQFQAVSRHTGMTADRLIDQGGAYIDNLFYNGLAPAIAQGYDPAQSDMVKALMGIDSDHARNTLQEMGIPGFAEGGLHAGGLRLVGERGWEVEATGPARIWNQQQLGAALRGSNDNAEVVAELKALRAEVERLRHASDQTARHTSGLPQMVDQFDNVTAGGNAMMTEGLA